jgi:L-fuculose-phosphate aldolase
MDSPFVLRKAIAEVGMRLNARGLAPGTDGSLSCRLQENRILITPADSILSRLSPGDLIIVDQAGNLVSGSGRPPEDFPVHVSFYRIRADIACLIHCFPVFCTAFAFAGRSLPGRILPELNLTHTESPLDPDRDKTSARILSTHDTLILEGGGRSDALSGI